MVNVCAGNRGFTLVEVLVASTIGAFLALVAVSTLRVVSTSAEMVDSNVATAAEVRFAARTIATDLVNLYRDTEQRNMKFVGIIEESGEIPVCCLTFYTVGRTKARIDQPEGDIYEVEYLLLRDEERSALTKRLWPNPNEELEPGGVLSVIAENIDVFQVRYFDGEQWQDEWPEEMRSLPELVEVVIAAAEPGRDNLIMESVLVNFAKSRGTGAGTLEIGAPEQ
jgi:general secretion pathway protein J